MSSPSDRSHAPAQVDGGEDLGGASGPAPASSRPTRAEDRPKERAAAADPAGNLVGAVLGARYQIVRLIGQGGMGAVYQAEHTHMRKRLAVKVLHPEMSRLPEVVARFEREAMAAGHMDHPNVAGATDFGKLDDGSFFLVLEFVEGKSLREAITQDKRLELGRALHIVRQIASALARAHALGIVHRDLKPENIMLVQRDDDEDFVKVLDFGIAKVPVGDLVGEVGQPPGQALTQLGMVYGTPEYMAPEQALGQPVDARADLYALGVMAFEMIAGARPYSHESKVSLLGMHVAAPIPVLSERAPAADVPPEIDAMITRLLAKDAAARYADAREFIDVLDALHAQLVTRGRIAAPPATQSARGMRGTRLDADGGSASAIALGPTRWAEATPGPRPAPRRGGSGGSGASWSGLASGVPSWVRSRRAAVLGGALGVLVIALLVEVRGGRGSPAAGEAARGGTGGDAPAASPSPPENHLDALVAGAQATLDRGDFATAIDELTAIERMDDDRADVHRMLERAYTGVRNTRDAMREARLCLTADPDAAADLKLQEDIRNAALLKDVQDDAFSLLETKMGPRGLDILYDVAYGVSGRMYPQAATRAKRALESAEVRSHSSPALAVLLDFREAKACEDKHELLDRARDQGDARLLSTLQTYAATRGCGFLGRGDCYPCMHKDRAINEAIVAIEERTKKER